MAYNLKQSLPPILKMVTLNIVTTHLFILLCFLLCTCLNVSSQVSLMMEYCINTIIIWNLYYVVTINKKYWGICLWNWKLSRLNLHRSFQNVFLITILLHYKVFEFTCHIFKNKPPPSHCPLKNKLYLLQTLSAWATGDVSIIPSFRIWDYVLHVEHILCVITNCGQHQWVIPSFLIALQALLEENPTRKLLSLSLDLFFKILLFQVAFHILFSIVIFFYFLLVGLLL